MCSSVSVGDKCHHGVLTCGPSPSLHYPRPIHVSTPLPPSPRPSPSSFTPPPHVSAPPWPLSNPHPSVSRPSLPPSPRPSLIPAPPLSPPSPYISQQPPIRSEQEVTEGSRSSHPGGSSSSSVKWQVAASCHPPPAPLKPPSPRGDIQSWLPLLITHGPQEASSCWASAAVEEQENLPD